MPYSFILYMMLNLASAGVTAWVYYFHINLWQAQGLVLASTAGTLMNGLSILFFSLGLLSRRPGKWLSRFLSALLLTPLFLGQLACLLFVLWQKGG